MSSRLVAPSCRLVANAIRLVAYFTQIVHYVQWPCYCCVSYPGYVPPRCSLVPKQGCLVWEHLVPFLVLKWPHKQSQGIWFFLGVGGMPQDPTSWCMLMQALFHCNRVSCSTLKFSPWDSWKVALVMRRGSLWWYTLCCFRCLCAMSTRRGSSCSKRRLAPMPTAKELGELERLKQNEVSLKSKIRSVSLRKMLLLAT